MEAFDRGQVLVGLRLTPYDGFALFLYLNRERIRA